MLNLKPDMKFAYYLKDSRLESDPRVLGLLSELGAAGFDVYPLLAASGVEPGTQMLLSFGGDGTFLSAAALSLEAGLPVLGVNFGRLGFLSENKPEDVVRALTCKDYSIEKRGMVRVDGLCGGDGPQLALNEICVLRKGAAMLGVDVEIDSLPLPTYWADGLVVATSSGSTAYSLSAGGPILSPATPAFVATVVCPHTLAARPLVLPAESVVTVRVARSEAPVALSADGVLCARLRPGDTFTATTAALKVRLLVLPDADPFAPLCMKLGWRGTVLP